MAACNCTEVYLQAVCRMAAKVYGVPYASVAVLDGAQVRHVAREGRVPEAVPPELSFCPWTVRSGTGSALVVRDAAADPRFAANPLVTGPTHIRFYAGISLKPATFGCEATLCIHDVEPRPGFGDGDMRPLRDLAAFVEAHLGLLAEHDGRRREAETLRTTLDGMAQGLIVVDADHRVRVSNALAAELLDVPRHLLREGGSIADLRRHQAHRGDFASLPEDLRAWLESGDPSIHIPVYEREGENGTVIEVRSRPMPGGGTIRTITDVTVQRAAERATRESERLHRLLADNVGDVIIWSGRDYRRRYVSPSIKAVLGREPAELVGTHPAELVHPDDLAGILQGAEDVRSGRLGVAVATARYRHRDECWVWLEVSFRCPVDPDTGERDGYVAVMRDVTARRSAEDAVRSSEARQRALVDALPQMVLVASAETGQSSFVNRHFLDYFGDSGDTLEARSTRVHPEDLHRFDALWRDACLRPGCHEGEIRFRRHDGAYRWHRMVRAPVVRENGTIDTVVSTALDIDDIVSARRELERTGDLLRMAQSAAGAGVWEWDPATDLLALSPESARMHGLSAADGTTVVTLADWKARVLPEDLPAVRAAARRNRIDGTTNVAEFRALDPEAPAGRRWVQSFGRVVGAGEGTRIVGLHLDVTQRREAEDSLRAREARLAVSEERLALALDSGDDGLFDADLERGTHWVSRRWVERLGYDHAACDAGHAFWLAAIHPDDVAGLEEAMRAHERGSTPGVEHEHRLRRADGRHVWVLLRARVVNRDASGRPLRLVGTLVDISRRKEVEGRIRYMAEHDALTGLANRHLFSEALVSAVSRARAVPNASAVLLCDLDRFKAVNDTRGHPVGDRVLCAAAERIRSVVRPMDLVARLGGDEFAVLLAEVDGRDGTALVAERVISALRKPLRIDRDHVRVGISVGGVVLDGGDAGTDEVFKRADVALYEAKASGRETFRLFEAATHERVTFRSLLALEIDEAVRRSDFYLAYQPILDVGTGTVSSCEALMRWRHPERGLISPGDFITVAEDTGAIVAMGAWALVSACREATVWPASVQVAVNVSTVQFRRDLVEVVEAALAETGLSPGRLILEVTESVLMHDPEKVLATLRRLKGMGVQIALDDFGTGYSSLSYLRSFPFDKLKIDRAFVRDIADPDAAAIVRAMVGIGERLGMSVVAEGVETAEQLDLVRRESCRHVQGFLFSRPLPPCEILAYIGAKAAPAA